MVFISKGDELYNDLFFMRDPLAALDMCVNTHSPDPDDISYAILRHIGEQSKAFCCLYLIAFGGRVLFSKLKR